MPDNLIIIDRSIDDVPQTWESLFHNNKSNLQKIFEKVGPVEIPLPIDVFEAYHLTPLPRVRVVIIGQDPYPNKSPSTGLPFAKGLAFSYSKTEGVSASMRNVILELKNTHPGLIVNHTNLVSWAYQGVFLLNTALSFKKNGIKNSDIEQWKGFISETIKEILHHNPNCIFVAWGIKAGSLLKGFKIKNLLVAGHPSPMNQKGFTGCGHFLKINKILNDLGENLIDWNLI